MKKLIYLLLALLLLGTAVTAYATADPEPVIDRADILSSEEAGQLTNALGAYGSGVLCVMTVPSLDGEDVAKYAERYAEDHDIGVLLLIAMQERKWCITASGAYENVIDGLVIDRISAKCVPYLREDDYFDAFMVYARECGYYLENYDPDAAAGSGVGTRLVICLVIGLAVGAIAAGIMAGKNKSVRPKSSAADYVRGGSMHVELSRDIYLYHHITRIPKSQNNGSSGGGGSRSTRSGSF